MIDQTSKKLNYREATEECNERNVFVHLSLYGIEYRICKVFHIGLFVKPMHIARYEYSAPTSSIHCVIHTYGLCLLFLYVSAERDCQDSYS